MRTATIFSFLYLLLFSQCRERACTEIGCVDGLVISYELEESTRAEVLLRSVNQETQLECGGMQTECSVMEVFDGFMVEEMEVSLYQDSVLLNHYVQQIDYQTTRPNGKGCDPVCNQAAVTISD